MGARKFTDVEHTRIISPLVDTVIKSHRKGKTTIIAFQGGQGTGKTTLVKHLTKDLNKQGYSTQAFSIDDFYKTAAERKKIQQKYFGNPFYQISRGMPGTHRVKELQNVLRNAKNGKPFSLPHFDKSKQNGFGDVLKKVTRVQKKQDFIILEGWCVGLPSCSSLDLKKICAKNKIDLKKIDPQNGYKVVLENSKKYVPLWKYIDYMVQIRPDSSMCHKLWRMLQERRLWKEKGEGMTVSQVHHFVDVYLPLTYVCYEKISVDALIKVDKKHNYYKIQINT